LLSHNSPQIIQNKNLKNLLKIKSDYIRNDTAETSSKNHLYHHTKPSEAVICDSDGMTGDRTSHRQEQHCFFNKLLTFLK
jgi:hypothetical protein